MRNAERVKTFFAKNLCFIVVFGISCAYVLTAFFSIGKTGKTVGEIIADGILTYVISTSILILLRSQGILNGAEDERVKETEEALGNNVEEVNDDLDKLDDWCEVENKKDLRIVRLKTLASVGLKYNDYFEDDVALDFKLEKPQITLKDRIKRNENFYKLKDYKRKRKGYKQALKVRIKPLTTTDLTTCNAKSSDPHDFGRDKNQYVAQQNAKNIFTKILIVFVMAYFGISIFSTDWASVLWKLFQVCLYIFMGVIQYVKSYMYMTDEYRTGVVKKIRFLQKFKNSLGGHYGKDSTEKE